LGIILFGIFGWVYSMGIVSPVFIHPFGAIYRGLGIGFIYPLYFLFIPTYKNKVSSNIPYSGAITSIFSFVLTLILLFITFPLQIHI
jgi:hypothetical protein